MAFIFPNRTLLTARAEGSNVLIHCHSDGSLRVFGATVPVSAVIGGDGVQSFMAHLPEGQDRGFIAVCVYRPNWSDGAILEVSRGDDRCAYVNLEEAWIPGGAQIVQVDRSGLHVMDVRSGMRFTTHESTAKWHGWMHVPDGSLLLSFVAGEKTVDDVRAAAQAHVEEQSARERLAEVEPRLARVEALATEVGVVVADLGTEYRRLKEIARWADEFLATIHAAGRARLAALWSCTSYQELCRLLGADPKKA